MHCTNNVTIKNNKKVTNAKNKLMGPDSATKQTERPDMNLVDADCLTKIADALKEIETLILRIDDLWKKFLNGNPKNP